MRRRRKREQLAAATKQSGGAVATGFACLERRRASFFCCSRVCIDSLRCRWFQQRNNKQLPSYRNIPIKSNVLCREHAASCREGAGAAWRGWEAPIVSPPAAASGACSAEQPAAPGRRAESSTARHRRRQLHRRAHGGPGPAPADAVEGVTARGLCCPAPHVEAIEPLLARRGGRRRRAPGGLEREARRREGGAELSGGVELREPRAHLRQWGQALREPRTTTLPEIGD